MADTGQQELGGQRELGASGIGIAPLVFGGNVFGWTLDEAGTYDLIDRFVAGGFNCIDTADVYMRMIPGNTGGESETLIGQWLARGGKRDSVVIATKVGYDMGEGMKGLSRRYIVEAVENSLRRLQTDYIDLYQSHFPDPDTPIEETLRGYEELVKSGKVRAIGASNYSAAQLAEALDTSEAKGVVRYQTLQPRYNLCDRDSFEGELQDLCVARNIGVIPYFSLAAGFLSGKYRSEADLAGKARGSMAGRYLNRRGLRILDALDAVAAEQGAKPAQVALAWLNTRPSIAAPIASATSAAQLDEIMAGARIQLSADQLVRLDMASAPED